MPTFHSLPAELMLNVFSNVRAIRDLKNCTLVSRAWYDHATQDLWHTFSSDFRKTSTRSRAALLRRGSAPLRLVKRVILRQGSDPTAEQLERGVEDNLMSFLMSVSGTSTRSRRSRIVEFSCEAPIPRFAFRSITMLHQHLEVCRIVFDEGLNDAHKCLSHDHWRGKYFEDLTTLQINVPQHHSLGRIESHWDTYRFIIKNAKKLHTLEIQCPLYEQAAINAQLAGLWPTVNQALTMRIPEKFSRRNILNLTELSLTYIDLGGKTTLMTEINFLQLRRLRIKSCMGEDPLLQATATLFTQNVRPKLEHFEFGNSCDGSAILGIHALVNSFAGLKVLHLDTSIGTAPSPQAIIRHAKTLTSLSVGKYHAYEHYDVDDLTAILRACKELQELGTSLGEESDHLEGWHKNSKRFLAHETRPGWEPDTLEENTIQGILEAIGTCGNDNLRVLRMLNVGSMESYRSNGPYLGTMTNALVAQAASQGFANDVFRFLHDRGSKIDLFVMQKFNQVLYIPELGYEMDGNRHWYPNYAYTTCVNHGRLGYSPVVAVPVTDLETVFPQVKILQHTLKHEL